MDQTSIEQLRALAQRWKDTATAEAARVGDAGAVLEMVGAAFAGELLALLDTLPTPAHADTVRSAVLDAIEWSRRQPLSTEPEAERVARRVAEQLQGRMTERRYADDGDGGCRTCGKPYTYHSAIIGSPDLRCPAPAPVPHPAVDPAQREASDPPALSQAVALALADYSARGIAPPQPIRAILEGDLFGAVAFSEHSDYAGDEFASVLAMLPVLAARIRDTLPSESWGSRERVERWIRRPRS